MREYYQADGELKPGKKGIALDTDAVAKLNECVDAVDAALPGGGASSAAVAMPAARSAAPQAAAAAGAAAGSRYANYQAPRLL